MRSLHFAFRCRSSEKVSCPIPAACSGVGTLPILRDILSRSPAPCGASPAGVSLFGRSFCFQGAVHRWTTLSLHLNDRPFRISERWEIGLRNRLFPRSRNCGKIISTEWQIGIYPRECDCMKKINIIINIFIAVFIGVFIGHGVYTVWDFKTHPELYVVQSAPWYTSILIYGVLTIILLLICIVIKVIINHKSKQKWEIYDYSIGKLTKLQIVKERIEGGANEKAVLRLFINCPFVCINFDFFWLNKARQLYMDF